MERRKRSIDMLSRLPDEILCHILSFLPTKTSVSTSVLAKSWRFLWAHVPNLEFSRYNFTGGKTQPLDIISRVLMLHKSKIVNTFNLFKVRGCAYQLLTLIIYPIKLGVRNLYLDFDYRILDHIILCTLPRLLFTCKTLVDLKLVCCGVIPSSGELFLPSLKRLNLRYVEYENDDSLPHLLSGCPELEELIINDYFRKEQKNSGCVIVSSPTIKKLNVSISQGLEHYPDEMLIIDVPALIYLEVYGCSLGHAKSLSKTMIIDCTEHVRSVEFLSCLCHVKYLKISRSFYKTPVLLVGNGSMAKFVRLTKLELDLTVDLHDVVKFLEVADNLQVLIIGRYSTKSQNECLHACYHV